MVVGIKAVHTDREHVCHPSQGDCDRMYIDSEHMCHNAANGVCIRCSCKIGRIKIVANRMKKKCSTTAACVKNALSERIIYALSDYLIREPVGGVVLAKLLSRLGCNNGLVQQLQDIMFDLAPREPS